MNVIAIDSSYSPIERINYEVEPARVGQNDHYDKLIMEVWTNGSITPEEAISLGSRILIEHFEILADLNRIAQELGLINEIFEASHIYIYYSVFARVFGKISRVFGTYIDNIDINETTDEALLERLIAPLIVKRSASTAKVILTFTRRNMDSDNDIFIPRNFEVMTEMTDNPIVFRTAEARILWIAAREEGGRYSALTTV